MRTHPIAAAAAAAAVFAGTSAAQTTWDVTIEGMNFVYNGQTNTAIDLVINAGDAVRWTWVSGFHNVVSGLPGDADAGSVFSSGDPTGTPGTVYEFTFNDIGVYDYHCAVHGPGGMVSQVRVVPGPGVGALLLPLGLLGARRRR